MSDPNFTDAQLIEQHNAILEEQVGMVERHKAELAPYNDAIMAIKAEMLLRLQERGAQNVSVEGAGTAYQQTTLSVKVDNRDEFLKFLFEDWHARSNFLDAGVIKDPVKAWLDANNGVPPPGITISNFTKCNIRRT